MHIERALKLFVCLMVFLVLLFLSAVGKVHAQQAPQQPPASPEVQALSSKLMDEISSNIQMRTFIVQAQERIKQLESELASSKAPPKTASK